MNESMVLGRTYQLLPAQLLPCPSCTLPTCPPPQVVRLWVHECERVFADRLVSETDMAKFNEFRVNVTRKFFEDLPQVWVGCMCGGGAVEWGGLMGRA